MKYSDPSIKIITDIDAFTLGNNIPSSLDALSMPDSFYNIYVKINQAYAYIFSLPFSFTDMKIGLQRTNTGAGEIMSTLDILNAYDQRDRWTYEKRLSSFIISILGYNGRLSWQADILPFYEPNILPSDISMPSFSMPSYVSIEHMTNQITNSNAIKDNAQIHIALSYQRFIGDISLHSFYWKEKTPWVDSVFVSTGSLPWYVNIHNILHYPRIQVGGISASSSIGSIGICGNIGLFYPQDNDMTIDLTAAGGNFYDSTNIGGPFYFKGDICVDYTFINGFYANAHYVHGMYYEYSNIHDYIFIGTRFPFFNDRIIISPLNSAFEIASYNNFPKHTAITIMPCLEYSNGNFTAGIRIMHIWANELCSFNDNMDYSGIGLYFKAGF